MRVVIAHDDALRRAGRVRWWVRLPGAGWEETRPETAAWALGEFPGARVARQEIEPR